MSIGKKNHQFPKLTAFVYPKSLYLCNAFILYIESLGEQSISDEAICTHSIFIPLVFYSTQQFFFLYGLFCLENWKGILMDHSCHVPVSLLPTLC